MANQSEVTGTSASPTASSPVSPSTSPSEALSTQSSASPSESLSEQSSAPSSALPPTSTSSQSSTSTNATSESPPKISTGDGEVSEISPSVNISDRSRRTTNFEWEKIPQAVTYEIELTPINKEGKKGEAFKFVTKEPHWDGQLKPGKYSMRLRSRDRRSVPGSWSKSEEFYVKLYAPVPLSPASGTLIKSNQDEESEVTLKWEKQTEASLFKIHIEDEEKRFSKDFESSETELKIKIPVSRKYFWSISGYDKLGNEGEKNNEIIPFTIYGKKLITPKITEPETQYVRNLKWSKVPFATRYKYSFFQKQKNRKWLKLNESETDENKISFDPKWEGGEYKLSVFAEGELREASNTHSVVFTVAKGARTIAAEKIAILRKAIDRTNNWYFIASYLITQIKYSSENWDNLSKPSMSGWGGTGRLGLGYLAEESPYGFFGIVDYSGFVISQKAYQYPSAEAHGIYRWSSGDIGEIRISGGAYYKELPEIMGQSLDDFKVSPIKAFGLHFGGEYWYSLTSKLGIQMNGRLYYPISGSGPNGKSIVASPSMQYGFLGSLKLNKTATGLMGYAYRLDNLKYKVSSDSAISEGHSTNESSVQGHYLNLYLEWDI